MNPLDFVYIPVIALFNLAIVAFWHKKFRKKLFVGKNDWIWLFACSFLNTWGIDVLSRLAVTHSWMDALKVSFGAWFLFSAATAHKYYRLNARSSKEFWLDYGGDLVSYIFMGIGVYICT